MKVEELHDFLGNGETLTVEKRVGDHNLIFALSSVNVRRIRTTAAISKEEAKYAKFDLMKTVFSTLRSGMNAIYDKVSDEAASVGASS